MLISTPRRLANEPSGARNEPSGAKARARTCPSPTFSASAWSTRVGSDPPGVNHTEGTPPRTLSAARPEGRAEPINTHTAKNGTVSYWFQMDVGTKPDGSRDRRKFTYPTKAEARKALRRISSEVAAGTYSKPTAITVDEAIDAWLAGRGGIWRVTLYSYENDLKPVRRFLGGKRLQQLTKADGDNLVRWMLTEARTSPKHYRPDSLAGKVAAMVAEHPEGITASELAAAFPVGDVHSCLSALLAATRITRLRRGLYAPAEPSGDTDDDTQRRGVGPQTIRSTLTTFSAVVQSYVDQGVLPRNIVRLV